MVRCFALACLLLAASSILAANIRHVPASYGSIQAAIDSSVHGDTVLVEHGTYYENIRFRGKKVLVASQFLFSRSQFDVEQTIINGSQPAHPDTASCVLFISGEDTNSILEGFTLTGGKGTLWRDIHNGNRYREGGGILLEFTSPIIRYNIIRNNEAVTVTGGASAGGGGIRVGDANPRIIGNVIAFNRGRYGGGIVLNYTAATIQNNIIYRNTGGEDFGGSGIWATDNGSGPKIIENNTILENSSVLDGGGIQIGSTSAVIRNNIVWGNTAPTNAQLSLAGGTFTVTYNDIEGGYPGTGNINANPKFMDTTHILQPASPCIDAGDPALQYNDIEDTLVPGAAQAPSGGSLRNDMGAFGGKSRSMLHVRIHLNAPRPPTAAAAYSDYLTPSSVQLSWADPTELFNGDPVGAFEIHVYRDSAFVASVSAGAGGYTDTGLVLHQAYQYMIYAVTAADSSPPALAGAIAGGSAVPRAPSSFVALDGIAGVELSWVNPSRQIDGTPLNDLALIYVYRDGVRVDSIAQSMADTGAARSYIDNVIGYHVYFLAAADNELPVHVSAPTATLFGYGGVTSSYAASFEDGRGGIYATGTWDTTSQHAYDGTHSLTDSPGGNYAVGTTSSVLLPPVIIGSGYVLQFENIAIVRGGHFAYVEISTNHRASYTTLKTFNWFQYPGWSDGVADSNDWVKFTFDLSPYAGDTATIRFRMNTGTGLGADGWYLDSIVVGAGGGASADSFHVGALWNMVSVPRKLSTTAPDSIYPGSSGRTFGYNGFYYRTDTLRHGVGYWAKFDSAQSYHLGGDALLRDTFKVNMRWNMIGSISYPVDSSAIKTVPSGIVSSSYFFYDHDSGYQATRTLLPGRAYWVKTSQAGKLIASIFYPAAAPAAEPKGASRSEIGSLTCIDALGRRAALSVFARGTREIDDELPPPPPVGAFDIRFSSDRVAETYDPGAVNEFPILLRSVAFPLRLEWSGETGALPCQLIAGEGEAWTLTPGRSVTMKRTSTHLSLRLLPSGGTSLPAEFALSQNYPNPFNPATTIRYELPRETHVRMTVWNMLGEEVATLVDGVEGAGYRSAVWNAGSAPSGVYFCRILAGSFQKSMPMVLIK